MKKIFDASSLVCILKEIEFPRIFDICREENYQLIVPLPVLDELRKNPESLSRFNSYGTFTVVAVDSGCYTKIQNRYPWMGAGEISVVCDALAREGRGESYYCVLDDNRAKNAGKRLSLRTTGTVGLLIWQKRKGAINQETSEELCHRFINSGFYIRKEILEDLMR